MNTAAIDVILLEQALHKIYYSAGLWSPQYMYLHIRPNGIYTDLLILRFFGPKSLVGHYVIAWIMRAFFLAVIFAVFVTPAAVAIWYGLDVATTSSKGMAIRGVACAAILLGVGASLLPILAIIPIKFSDAELNESTGEPTPEFIERVRVSAENDDQVKEG